MVSNVEFPGGTQYECPHKDFMAIKWTVTVGRSMEDKIITVDTIMCPWCKTKIEV